MGRADPINGVRSGQLRRLARQAERAGWVVVVSGTTHLRLFNPVDASRSFWISTTANDKGRTLANVRADARRAGLEV